MYFTYSRLRFIHFPVIPARLFSPSYRSRAVVPKLGVMPPQGAMGLLPGSHGRILKKYIFSTISVNRLIKKECQGLILKFGLFEFLEF